MIDQEYGKIINIASTNGINTYYPMCIDYDASKAALISMTHNLAFEFAPFVNVNCIAPGFIGTENELNGYDEQFLKEEVEKIMVIPIQYHCIFSLLCIVQVACRFLLLLTE